MAGKAMQRRMLLLFTLFVVTAWFYSSMSEVATDSAVKSHQQQIQILGEAENALTGGSEDFLGKDQG